MRVPPPYEPSRPFVPPAHLGRHLWTIQHSIADAHGAWILAALTALAGVSIRNAYGGAGHAGTLMFGMLSLVIAGLGVQNYLRARDVFHIHERGVVRFRHGLPEVWRFDDVARLDPQSWTIKGRTHVRIKLFSATGGKFQIGDDFWRGNREAMKQWASIIAHLESAIHASDDRDRTPPPKPPVSAPDE